MDENLKIKEKEKKKKKGKRKERKGKRKGKERELDGGSFWCENHPQVVQEHQNTYSS